MKKSYFTKIFNGRGRSTSSDFSVKEKEMLFSFFENHGMKRSTAYNRFFRDGFKDWELNGVECCIKDFCISNEIPCPSDMRSFFRTTDRKELFVSYIGNMGMSRSTVYKRFKNFSFKDWEIVGIRTLIDRLLAEEVENA